METPAFRHALVVGAGSGLSASIARLFSAQGMRVSLAARDVEKLRVLRDAGMHAFACDASRDDEVARLFREVEAHAGAPDVVVYNPSARARGALLDIAAADVQRAFAVTAFGAFCVAQQAARRMLPNGHGAILFTGASASIKGYAQSAPFAMAKFALRGLAQSLARELSPKGIHVAHFVIDGGILQPGREPPSPAPDALLDPDAIAQSYLHVLQQPRSAWTWEVELRPWVEKF